MSDDPRTKIDDDRMAARLKLVDEHIALENRHDLEGIMGTFGASAHYDDEPWDLHYAGRDEVRAFYQGLLQALPGLHIDVKRRHASDRAIVMEVIIRGRHLGSWRGLPATGRQIDFPICGIFTFDDEDRLAGEKILLRPGYGASATRAVSRTGQRDRPHHERTDPSHDDGANRRSEALEVGLAQPAGLRPSCRIPRCLLNLVSRWAAGHREAVPGYHYSELTIKIAICD